MKQDTDNILLTGGHAATTGIAVIEEIKKRMPKAKISWVGSKAAVSGSKVTTLEYKIYPTMGVEFFTINAGKLQTKFTRHTIPHLLMIPVGFFQALLLVLKLKPKVILSFGGASSFPIIFWGSAFGIPTILHEQTLAAGRAAMASAYIVSKIALSREESLKHFPKGKCVITGNPLMSSILSVPPITTHHLPFTILIMGGSRGSEFINEEIFKILPELIKIYKVIHITGERDFEKYRDLKLKNYRVLPFVDPREMAKYYIESDMVIERSGANSVSELLYVKRPAILIPLPRTFMGEQVKNARYAENFGIARVILETEVSSESLMLIIKSTISNWSKTVSKVKNMTSPDVNASGKVVDLIESCI